MSKISKALQETNVRPHSKDDGGGHRISLSTADKNGGCVLIVAAIASLAGLVLAVGSVLA